MEKALNKILDIVSDISLGLSYADDSRDFLRGYLFALKENEEITRYEFLMLVKFYDKLVADKRFVAEQEDEEW